MIHKLLECLLWINAGVTLLPSLPFGSRASLAIERKAVCTPNLINRAGSGRWLMLCGYQGKLLESEILSSDMTAWTAVDTTLTSPHSFASTPDGSIVLVDNTDAHSVRWYKRVGGAFVAQGDFSNVGIRPHRTIYNMRLEAFLVLGSQSATVSFFPVTSAGVVVRGETVVVNELREKYSRSFSLIDDELYFVSDPGIVTRARIVSNSIVVMSATTLPLVAKSPNDIFRAKDGRWYISATPRVLIGADSLEDFQEGKYINLYEGLSIRGTPYYLSEQNEGMVIPYVTEESGALLRAPGAEFRSLFNFGT